MGKFWKAALCIGGALVVLVAIFLLAVIWVFSGPSPTHDQALLKAIKVESLILMANHSNDTPDKGALGGDWITVPKSRLPRAVASVSPQDVTIFKRAGVDITIRIFFDDGWGYYVPLNERKPPEPAGRFVYLGQGVYWYHRY